jgi:hypothetical protein
LNTQLHVKLDPMGIAAPTQRAALIALDVIAASLNGLAEGELQKPEMPNLFIRYQIRGPEMTSDQRRVMYENWLLARGFQDLARGIRESLEEAALYLSIAAKSDRLTTIRQLDSEITRSRRRASRLQFPELMAEINAGLTTRLAFSAEFLSIQKVRNCLEHRGGVVGVQDTDIDGILRLRFPRFKIFYYRKGEEIEVRPDERVDAEDGEPEVQIMMRCVAASKTYRLGERITFNANQFSEIAVACNMFATDLAAKLPTLSV